MYDNSDMSLQEWPTLDDVVNRRNLADGRLVQNGKSASNENGIDNATGCASLTENEGSNANNIKAMKKNSTKRNNWTRLPINTPPYRQRGVPKRHDSTRPFENGCINQNGNNYSNGSVNGRGNTRSRGVRSNRGRGFSSFRRREMTTVDSENSVETEVPGHCINGAVFYSSASQYKNISAENLKEKIKRQIEYYFSEENLSSDVFIRRKMDKQGFVPLSLIATFNRMRKLTNDMEAIVEAVKESSKLELHDDFLVRPVVDPLRWPAPYNLPSLRTDVPEFYPGQPYEYVNVEPVIEQINNLHLNGTVYPTLSTPLNLQYPPNSIENVNGFSVLEITNGLEQESNGVEHCIDDPAILGLGMNPLEDDSHDLIQYTNDPAVIGVSGQDSNGLDQYVEDQVVTNGLDQYVDDQVVIKGLDQYVDDQVVTNGLDQYVDDQVVTNGFNYYSNDSSPVQQINGFDYFSQPISNGVMFYNNQQSSKGSCYSVLSPVEKLSNDINTPDDNDHILHDDNKSPEPSR